MSVSRHYQQSLQYDLILQRVRELYPQGASAYQLAPLDQLHIGGILASERLLENLSELADNAAILELGSGLGGLARLATSVANARFTCLDISHQLNRLHSQISRHQNGVEADILTADATAIPLADQSFDCVILQHSLLNIPDSEAALAECWRVLRPDGQLILHEVLQGPDPEQMRYPVPWASTAELSHLVSVETLRAMVAGQFSAISIDDWTADALSWRQRQLQKERKAQASSNPQAGLSPALVLGAEFPRMGANVAQNLESGAIRVVELKAQKALTA
ncbi:class I SAM-dependent methyltransferase [Marinobacterium jannaschii]|uniref:class I SAM-dependent methyltransferase n=1 Tax=Marinobacterium jannaschii TaxID=64970 RepID=UPI00048261F0|nr:class I SAM-dependent methyltransferase [Marinobacterium jannaschii]